MTTLAAAPPRDDGAFRNRISPEALGASILVADDQSLNLSLVCAYLRNIGFTRLDTATDGVMALEKVRAKRPDLLILDIVMPGLDGYAVCRALRADPDFAELPILVQTGLKGTEDRLEIFRSGATDLIVKPINGLELGARASAHLERGLLIRGLRQNAERIAQELRAATEMQVELLPSHAQQRALARHGLDLASSYTASSELGGDFWGLIDAGPDRAALYVADFAGHGVTAALNTVRMHTLVRQMPAPHRDPATFLAQLNGALAPLLPTGQFATAACAIVDPAARTIAVAAAGTPPLLLRAPDGHWQALDGTGLPLGIVGDATYTTHMLPFEPDALMFLHSDALAEVPLRGRVRLGDDGVRALARAAPADDARRFLDHVLGRFRARLDGPLTDDLTAIAIRHAGR